MIDLSGPWRAHVGDDELRRAFSEIDFDDSSWDELWVPGHWRRDPAFADVDAPVLHRRRFTARPVPEGRRAFLQLDGIFYQGDVFLDGAYLGDTEGYFVPHTFEITAALRATDEHAVAIEVSCTPQKDRRSKRNLTGVFQHWDCIDPDWNPGGIWRGAHITETGPIRIDRLRVLCVEANQDRAVLQLRAMLDVTQQRVVKLHSTVAGADHEQELTLAAGRNRAEWRVTINRPKLWWPHALGAADLVDLRVQAIDVLTNEVSDERTVSTGLRQVRRKDWVWEINGERFFLKGANQGPLRMAIAEVTPDEARRDMLLARDAGLDLVRMHAHIGHPATYAAADEFGMLIWQDLPLQWGYARSVRKQAVRQAREAVDLLGHHPSIAHWCGHNEPLALDIDPDINGSPKKAAQMIGKYIALQELPTWNKSVLDFSIHRALTKADPSRPVTAHSGILPGPTSGGTDTHLYFGWYHGNERDLPGFLAKIPRLARFVSEFGAQAVPASADFCEPHRWPALEWERLGHDHCLQKVFFDKHVPPAQYETFDEWRDATQAYQAELLRRHIEELRRLKYRPTGGFTLFSFGDSLDHPAVTWSVLGHDRLPKLGYEAVTEACRPVIVVADRLPELVRPGDAIGFDVHVVSDLRRTLSGARVTARLSFPGAQHVWRWEGDITADACVRVGMVDLVVPALTHPAVRGGVSVAADPTVDLELDLVLEHPEITATNRYHANVLR